jgi:cysteine-rich repeat protein
MLKLRSCALALVLAFAAAPLTACSNDLDTSSTAQSLVSANCTLTIGYWKTHPEAWPVSSLQLGSVSYTQAQLLAIFNQSVNGNGLVALAHQLIGAKLNVAAGASSGSVAGAIAAADSAIGSRVVPPIGAGYLKPSATSSLVAQLDSYNTGATGPGHCGDTPPPVCGDGRLDAGEACDDGNTANGDGCSATCCVEPPPPACGDGHIDAGETCDDGNTVDGDGCSATCCVEPPPPVCGDGNLDAGEVCDDGNNIDGDGCSADCLCDLP